MAQSFRLWGWLGLVLACVIGADVAEPPARAEAGAFEDGVNFYQGGHYRWALEKFIEAIDQAPRDLQRRWYLAESYRQLGDSTAAVHVYRQILQMAPQSPQAAAARQSLTVLGESASTTTQVAFRTRGTSVLVPARVNGQSIGYFILDTGATFTSISRGAADLLGITSGGGFVNLATASGLTRAPFTLLDEVDVGGAVARHVPAVIHDLPNTPSAIVGLLGLSFLERFRVSLDIASGVLILESGEKDNQ